MKQEKYDEEEIKLIFLMLLISVCLVGICIYLLYRETKLFSVNKENIYFEKITGSEVKIAFLSDLHNYSYGNDNDILIEAVQKEKPDLIIISGDMIIAKPLKKDLNTALRLLKRLPPIAPVYYANGNHEFRMKIYTETYGERYFEFKQKLIEYGIRLLENEKEEIYIKGNHFLIYGLEIEREYYQRGKKVHMEEEYIIEKLGKYHNKGITLLIAHNPVYFPVYAKWGADLTFSGHLHGGLVRIPGIGGVVSPQLEFFPKYDAGLYDIKGKKLMLSRGLGAHTLHIRVFNRAELKIVTLKK